MSHFSLAELSCKPPEAPRHWHSQSQAYAGGDCLLSALDCDWTVKQVVHCYRINRGNRKIVIHFFELQRANEALVMPVISNPFIERLLVASPLEVAIIADADWSLWNIHTAFEVWQSFILSDASMSLMI